MYRYVCENDVMSKKIESGKNCNTKLSVCTSVLQEVAGSVYQVSVLVVFDRGLLFRLSSQVAISSPAQKSRKHRIRSVRFGSFHHFNSFHFRILVSPRFIERQGRKTPCRDMLCQSKTVIQNTASTFVGRDWWRPVIHYSHGMDTNQSITRFDAR